MGTVRRGESAVAVCAILEPANTSADMEFVCLCVNICIYIPLPMQAPSLDDLTVKQLDLAVDPLPLHISTLQHKAAHNLTICSRKVMILNETSLACL